MVATKVRQPKTYEDYLATPDDGQRYELIDGEIVVSPSGTMRHQIISMKLSNLLYPVVAGNRLGKVVAAPMDVRLDRDLVVQPDLIVILGGSPADNPNELRVVGPPNLAIEILSPSTAMRDLNRKREIYERYGVEEYWIIDADRKAVTALSLVDGAYTPIRQLAGRLRSNAVAGLVLDIKWLFEDVF
jgi:Uma2 family endonuclease